MSTPPRDSTAAGQNDKRAHAYDDQAAGMPAADSSALREFMCSICTDTIYKLVVLECTHSFCNDCIDTWFKQSKTCPECRVVHRGAVNNVRAADNAIEQLVRANCTEEEKSARAQRIAQVEMAAKTEAIRLAECERAKIARDQNILARPGRLEAAAGSHNAVAAAVGPVAAAREHGERIDWHLLRVNSQPDDIALLHANLGRINWHWMISNAQ